ncbi:MAG: hypothetical protein WD025_04640, partial [Bacteriovoracaceae bacterium]
MLFIKKYFIVALFILTQAAVAQDKAQSKTSPSKSKELPILKAKQALDNIRFISRDGKFTYYQRRSGDLQVSSNYSNELVMEGSKFTEYLVISSNKRKKLLISKDSSFHSQMSHLKTNDIFVTDFGASAPALAASGVNPKLHLEDAFMSYYLPEEKKINIQRLAGEKKTLSIELVNSVNPFYLPQVFMLSPNDVVYSDINSKGHEGLLAYSFLDKKIKPLYKSSYPGSKIEACFEEQNLYVGEFVRGKRQGGSKILKIPLYNNQDFQSFKVLYQSQQGDLGNMVCQDDKIFFIKTLSYNQELNLKETEVASLSLKTGEVEILSNLKYVTQLVDMDGSVMAPYRSQYYIVKGEAALT